jgi:hypothetical protein
MIRVPSAYCNTGHGALVAMGGEGLNVARSCAAAGHASTDRGMVRADLSYGSHALVNPIPRDPVEQIADFDVWKIAFIQSHHSLGNPRASRTSHTYIMTKSIDVWLGPNLSFTKCHKSNCVEKKDPQISQVYSNSVK